MTDTPPSFLGGEADPNVWHFSRFGEVGPLPNPSGHTFPLITHDVAGCWRLIGTGFYINDGGSLSRASCHRRRGRDGEQLSPLGSCALGVRMWTIWPIRISHSPDQAVLAG